MTEPNSDQVLESTLAVVSNPVYEEEDDQHIDPWTAKGSAKGFDYLKLLRQFGTKPIDETIIERIEKLTNMRVHRFLRRGIFFSQQDLEKFLDHYESGRPVYIYTGRGASSESMHLGHIVPFELTKYLQDAFGCILVIQMSDDEKYYFKGGESLDHFTDLAKKNARDIISVGFNPDKTYIFSNREEMGRGNPGLIDNMIKMASWVGMPEIQSAFGLDRPDKNGSNKTTVGQVLWPICQSIPSYSSSFKFLFSDDALCLVPMAIDQAPYFRVARHFSSASKYLNPACLHSEFLVGLSGRNSKMSSTEAEALPPIFLTDSERIARDKIKPCFSGGGETKKEHIENGGDLTVDVAYLWLTVFLEDDNELEYIAKEYSSGRMMSHEIKKRIADCVVEYLRKHQEARSLVTEEVVAHFFNPRREFDHSRPVREPLILLTKEQYMQQGANFDRNFGCVASV